MPRMITLPSGIQVQVPDGLGPPSIPGVNAPTPRPPGLIRQDPGNGMPAAPIGGAAPPAPATAIGLRPGIERQSGAGPAYSPPSFATPSNPSFFGR